MLFLDSPVFDLDLSRSWDPFKVMMPVTTVWLSLRSESSRKAFWPGVPLSFLRVLLKRPEIRFPLP